MSAAATVPEGRLRRLGRPVRRRAPLGWPVVVAGCFLAMMVLFALAGDLIAPKDPGAQSLVLSVSSPSGAHLLGTDELGRDVLSRVIVGARYALIGPLVVALGAMVLGNVLGVLAGYLGGAVDSATMRWADLMYALPPLLVALVIAGVLGGGYLVAISVLILLFAPYDARLVRGAVLGVRHLPYVEAARTLGVSKPRIMAFEVWPNVAAVAVANAFLNFAYALVALASLSFLGIGVPPGAAEWGRMLSESKSLIFINPAAAVVPALMIVATAASMNLIGDVLYERLADRGKARG